MSDDKQHWRESRVPGDPVATFRARELIRCPGTRLHHGQTVVCGEGCDSVGEGWVVTVRAGERRFRDRESGAINRVCRRCHTRLSVTVERIAKAA